MLEEIFGDLVLLHELMSHERFLIQWQWGRGPVLRLTRSLKPLKT